ncbi:hypothetical protein LUZ63_020232 [Rhynchospora breviuscula]|uniref:Large ribosomal subunit protein bL17c n=1 Tax=Rhynchospora breviuscula TaxID=2022672 RepID=A0A9P9ZAA1_9POAL|nr:hypothetical protein LUZ63_020232 [Rhynchospora breviuscula]
MPTPKKGARLGGGPDHQRLLISNLATSLFEHGRITTTEAKARVLRPVAEKLISKAKKAHNDETVALHNRREVLKTIRDKSVVHTLFADIAPTFAERPGGYTRITKIGPRKGDNAPMAVIELVTEAYTPAPAKPAASKAAPAETPAPVAADETPADDADATAADVPTDRTEETPVEGDAPVQSEDVTEEAASDEAPAEDGDQKA